MDDGQGLEGKKKGGRKSQSIRLIELEDNRRYFYLSYKSPVSEVRGGSRAPL